MQLGLLSLCERHEGARGLRVPQSGWMHEPHSEQPHPDSRHGILRNTYRRVHRWQRLLGHEDPLATGVVDGEDSIAHVLFSSAPDDVKLYGKPMHETPSFGPTITGCCWTVLSLRGDLEQAAEALAKGGHFGYRFYFPPMELGRHAVFWHRPLVAFRRPGDGEIEVLDDAPPGYLTAYRADRPALESPVELWPRILCREPHRAVVGGFAFAHDHCRHRDAANVRRLLHVSQTLGQRPLPASFARNLLTLPKEETLDAWLAELSHMSDSAGGMPPRGEAAAVACRHAAKPRAGM